MTNVRLGQMVICCLTYIIYFCQTLVSSNRRKCAFVCRSIEWKMPLGLSVGVDSVCSVVDWQHFQWEFPNFTTCAGASMMMMGWMDAKAKPAISMKFWRKFQLASKNPTFDKISCTTRKRYDTSSLKNLIFILFFSRKLLCVVVGKKINETKQGKTRKDKIPAHLVDASLSVQTSVCVSESPSPSVGHTSSFHLMPDQLKSPLLKYQQPKAM